MCLIIVCWLKLSAYMSTFNEDILQNLLLVVKSKIFSSVVAPLF